MTVVLTSCASVKQRDMVESCKMQCSETDQIVDTTLVNACSCMDKPKSKELQAIEKLAEQVDVLTKLLNTKTIKEEVKTEDLSNLAPGEDLHVPMTAPVQVEDIAIPEVEFTRSPVDKVQDQ